MRIKDFQQLIAERYKQRDSLRGTPKTFMWFVEEVGELATALADEKSTQQEKEEEFADILALHPCQYKRCGYRKSMPGKIP
jgi:NTP pyrophosphatase (non-canonical NTP hydrolase)